IGDVDIPLGLLTADTGVGGSGKTSLIHGNLAQRDDVVIIDQQGIRAARRSDRAPSTGASEPLRKDFAKASGVQPALCGASAEEARPTGKGAGVTYTELAVMENIATVREECDGKRYQPDVLNDTLGGYDISQVLEMSAAEAKELFSAGEAKTPAASKIL